MGENYIAGRGATFCRGCLSNELFPGINLGKIPIANELWKTEKHQIENFSLHLRVCQNCGLGQVEDVVTPERIFRDYRYLSSVSSNFLDHARTFCKAVMARGLIDKNGWVLEIASNDGYLLKNFLEMGIKVIGVEPALNVALISQELGIETLTEFFSLKLAKQLLGKFGYPSLIVANNVMAHVPDLFDFTSGLALLCGANTKISVENPSLLNIANDFQFDTIYHEHYSYLTATSVAKLCQNVGLELFDTETLTTHGGSNRYWLQKKGGSFLKTDRVKFLFETENKSGVFSRNIWVDLNRKVEMHLEKFNKWANDLENNGQTICGYGAAAKASTLLNAADIPKGIFKCIGDSSSEKQGRFLPSTGIPIVGLQRFSEFDPTDVLIFTWNISDEILNQIKPSLKNETRYWTAIPRIAQLRI